MAIGGSDGSIILNTKVDTKGLNGGLNSMKGAITKIGGLLAAAFSVKTLINFAKESKNLYKIQMQNEVKLATVMRQRMKATDDEIKSMLELASAQQQIGIIGDEVQLAGLQQVATFATQKETIETLLPAMNNLIAQQYGYEASTESARNVANLMGKVLQGQVGALTRVGITFSETEEQMLKTGNEMERAAVLAKVITNNVGEMNTALAQTDIGRQQQLANTWGDIKEQFGEAVTQIQVFFLPALKSLAQVLSQVAVIFKAATNSVFGRGKEQKAEWQNISSSAGESVENQNALTEAVEETADAQKEVLTGFDKLNVLSKGIEAEPDVAVVEAAQSGVSGGLINAVEQTDKEMPAFVRRIIAYLDPLRKPLQNLWLALKPDVGLIFKAFKEVKEKVLMPMIDFAVNDYYPALIDTTTRAVYSLKKAFSVIASPLKDVFENNILPILENARNLGLDMVRQLGGVFDYLGEKIVANKDDIITVIKAISTILSLVWALIKPILAAFVETLGSSLNLVTDWAFEVIGAFASLIRFFENAFKGIFALLNGNTEEAKGYFKKSLEEIINYFVHAANAAIAIINSLWTAIFTALKGIVNGIGGLISKIGKIAGKNWQLKWNANAPLIPEIPKYVPKLAKGAVIPPNREFMAVLGDQKNGRNLELPESLMRQIVREEGGGGSFTIEAKGNMAQFLRYLDLELKRENKRASVF